MSHLSHRSQNGDINVDHDRESRRNPGLSENIYESLDFRESIDIDSEDDNLPDILKHTNSTKSRNKNTTDEIYESLDHYQVVKIFFIANICDFSIKHDLAKKDFLVMLYLFSLRQKRIMMVTWPWRAWNPRHHLG